jgi:HAD superfamily hydrolase (TIGR01509 family)
MRFIVFDMDGLMFNTEDVYTLVGAELLRRRGCEFTAELKHRIMGLRPQPAFERLIDDCGLDDTWQNLAAESNRLFLELLDGRLRPMPGLMKLLDALETAEIPKAIGTSSGRELVDACLRPFDLERRFQFVLTAEDVTHGKPHPEIYLTAAQRFGTSPAEMTVLEDSENGCRAAAAAGA